MYLCIECIGYIRGAIFYPFPFILGKVDGKVFHFQILTSYYRKLNILDSMFLRDIL